MLASQGVPRGIDGCVAEPKLDGWRARVLVDGDELQVRTRSGRVITESVPAAQGLRGLRAVLDGELVADSGRLSDFYRLGPVLAVKRGRKVPVAFVAFDLLWQDGEMLVDRPWSDRRAALEDLDVPSRGVPVASVYGWEQIRTCSRRRRRDRPARRRWRHGGRPAVGCSATPPMRGPTPLAT
jgi:ATP-dependent DNA ligase